METFAFWKAMNNQIARIVFCKVSLFGVIAAGVASGPVAQARSSGPEAFLRDNPAAEAEAQAQAGVDRIPVTLSDPARPALVNVTRGNGSITLKAHGGTQG